LRKIGIAMIGVFGAAMEEMQVLLTLVLVFFFIILLTTKTPRPYCTEKATTMANSCSASRSARCTVLAVSHVVGGGLRVFVVPEM
jgi:hypothetical protein